MKKAMILVGMGIGAGLMFALDPQQGNRRRAVARDKLAKAVHKTGHAMGVTSRDVANRATGLAASLQSRFFDDNAPDDVVAARVRARLGRVSSHPGAIEVAAHGGVITLLGPVFKNEMDEIVDEVSSVRGVTRVENRLQPHDVGAPVSGLQGARHAKSADQRLLGAEWSPTMKLAVGVTGTALAGAGAMRRDKLGMLMGGVGLALLARAVGDSSIHRLFEGAEQYVHRTAREEPQAGVSIPIKFGPRPEGTQPPEPTQPPGTVH